MAASDADEFERRVAAVEEPLACAQGDRAYRFGKLADLVGTTVRTLRHNEEVGLVGPAQRTGSGHRL